MTINTLRKTSNDKLANILRVLVGFIFVMAGVLKMVVPDLGLAFSGQLDAADIPLPGLVQFVFPIVETLLGVLLVVGLHTRIVAALSFASMLVATYVHVVVEDPALFPLQPVEPVGPIMLMAFLAYLLWKGGGALSMDLIDT